MADAYAQAVAVPRSVEADSIARQAETLRQQPAPEAAPIIMQPQQAVQTQAPPGADTVHFVLHSIAIGGSSVYSKEQLAETYKDLIDKDVTLADIYGVADRIAQRYHTDGYLLASAFLPPQSIADGAVRIDVVEGYVARVTWRGDPLDSDIAQTLAQRLAASYPFNGKALENIVLQLNSLPSVSAQATMAPYQGADALEGGIEIVLTIARKHISAQASVDDYASRYQGVWEDSYQATLAGVISPIDQLSLNTMFSADPRYTHYFRGEYSIPINADGTSLKFGSSKSESAPGYKLADVDIRSTLISNWIGASQSLILTREETLSLDSQFNMNNQATDILGQRFYDDRLRTLQFSGTYTRADEWGGANSVNIGVEHGFNILNATQPGDPLLSRRYGESDFTKATFNGSRLQALGENFSALAAATAQASNAPLLSSEQFGFGGPAFGRAYDSSEITGDDGAAASLELRYNNLNIWDDFPIQPFIYYDIGKIWNRVPQGDIRSAASAGEGFRFQCYNHLEVEFTMAKPLTLPPATPKLGAVDMNPRYNVSIKLMY